MSDKLMPLADHAELPPLPPIRPEFERFQVDGVDAGDDRAPNSSLGADTRQYRRPPHRHPVRAGRRLGNLCQRGSDNPLLFPTFSDTIATFWDALVHGPLLDRIATSLRILLIGYAAGIVLAGVFTTSRSRPGRAGSAHHADRDVQSPAGDRAAAAGVALVRPRRAVAGLRDRPFRALGGVRSTRMPASWASPTTLRMAGPQLRAARPSLRVRDPDSGRLRRRSWRASRSAGPSPGAR